MCVCVFEVNLFGAVASGVPSSVSGTHTHTHTHTRLPCPGVLLVVILVHSARGDKHAGRTSKLWASTF